MESHIHRPLVDDTQCNVSFSIIETDAQITRWRLILSVGKVYHISELSFDANTDGERNVITNNYKLVFMPGMRLLGIIDDC